MGVAFMGICLICDLTSDVISRVICLFGIVLTVSSCSTFSAFRSWRVIHRLTNSKVIL
jgi:hypothetical protein